MENLHRKALDLIAQEQRKPTLNVSGTTQPTDQKFSHDPLTLSNNRILQKYRKQLADSSKRLNSINNMDYTLVRQLRTLLRKTDEAKDEIDLRTRIQCEKKRYIKTRLQLEHVRRTPAEQAEYDAEWDRIRDAASRYCPELATDWRKRAAAQFANSYNDQK